MGVEGTRVVIPAVHTGKGCRSRDSLGAIQQTRTRAELRIRGFGTHPVCTAAAGAEGGGGVSGLLPSPEMSSQAPRVAGYPCEANVQVSC